MPEPAQPVAAAAGAAGAAAPQADGWDKKIGGVARSMMMFLAMQYAMKYGMSYFGLTPKPADPAAQVPVPLEGATDAAGGVPEAAITGASVAAPVVISKVAHPIWPLGTPMSMLLYVSTAPDANHITADAPTVIWDDLTYGNWKDVREEDLLLDVPETVRSDNGSWYMDVLLVKDGGSPVGRPAAEVAHHRKELTRWMPKRRVRKEKSLLAKEEDKDADAEPDAEDAKDQVITAYWSRNLTLAVISDAAPIEVGQVHPPFAPFYHLGPRSADDKLTYYPTIFPNDFWLLKENLIQINDTTKQLPVRVSYQPMSHMKFQLFAGLTVSFEQAAQQQGTGGEMDEVKRMLTETNPILLITTAVVTVLHMLFEFLAFSSDVKHWRQKGKNNVGVSLRTIITNCFVQLVILLYLHDSSEETSLMILFTQGIGLLIEAWKITKIVDIRLRPDPTSIVGYRVTFEDKHELSEEEKKTQEYDKLAFKLVSYVAIPTLIAYAGYSLKYKTHRSWYSYIITTLAQAIYMFGFVQLIPQLIINYKLKSVAHMPMKAMVYKTLSTVVDDFFAFCIKMPWLHRLACFRDDVCFLVLCGQMWIYRVDYTRTNEYGQVGSDDKAVTGDKIESEEHSGVDKAESKKDK